jgi:hypothetical protein
MICDVIVLNRLVQTCGDFASSQVAARAALYLLGRLLDVEKNKGN